MIDFLNLACAILTIAFGLFGLIAPRYTAQVLDLETTKSNMGLSELRASAGGLFVSLGLGCILIGAPMAYAMMGVVYTGAAVGRIVSMMLDKPPQPKAFYYFAFEAIFAAWLLWANL